jgi:uncharacterized protein YeaO (DUF488 family)
MRYYPRGLKKELRDEYDGDLAPSVELFRDFKKHQARSGHDAAFALSHYEDRFELTPRALARLKDLSVLSRSRDVFLTCQCGVGERCHREILLLLARAKFGAKIGKVYHDYPRALQRLAAPISDEADDDARRGGSSRDRRRGPPLRRSRTAPGSRRTALSRCPRPRRPRRKDRERPPGALSREIWLPISA